MSLYFITGNSGKFIEARMVFPDVVQYNKDLPELQEIDPKRIIEAKLQEASRDSNGGCFVEDTSMYFECLEDKLPGPLIKWFLQTLGNEGIADLVAKYENNRSRVTTMIGYMDTNKKLTYFEATTYGTIVSPRGDKDFGWGPIFQPDGHDKTFGEMDREEKAALSMRGVAMGKLKAFLEKLA